MDGEPDISQSQLYPYWSRAAFHVLLLLQMRQPVAVTTDYPLHVSRQQGGAMDSEEVGKNQAPGLASMKGTFNTQKVCTACTRQCTQWRFISFSRVRISQTGNIQGIHLLTNWNMRMKGFGMILRNFMSPENQHGLIKIAMKKQEDTPIKAR